MLPIGQSSYSNSRQLRCQSNQRRLDAVLREVCLQFASVRHTTGNNSTNVVTTGSQTEWSFMAEENTNLQWCHRQTAENEDAVPENEPQRTIAVMTKAAYQDHLFCVVNSGQLEI